MMVFPAKSAPFPLTVCGVLAYNLAIYAQKRHSLNKNTPTQGNRLKTANNAPRIARKNEQERARNRSPGNNRDFATFSKTEQNRTNCEIGQKSASNLGQSQNKFSVYKVYPPRYQNFYLENFLEKHF